MAVLDEPVRTGPSGNTNRTDQTDRPAAPGMSR
jgi:hypothetical protein